MASTAGFTLRDPPIKLIPSYKEEDLPYVDLVPSFNVPGGSTEKRKMGRPTSRKNVPFERTNEWSGRSRLAATSNSFAVHASVGGLEVASNCRF